MEIGSYAGAFHRAIRDGKNENSYKLAWARALIEIATHRDPKDPSRTVKFEEIAEKMFGYYWDHTIYFDLYQGQNPARQPEIVQLVRSAIEAYQLASREKNPISYVRVKPQIDDLPKYVKKVARILKQDVSHRFLNLGSEILDLYKFDLGMGELYMAPGSLESLRFYRSFLLDAVCLKWAQACEKWNRSPRITSKVQIVLPGGEPKRGALKRFLEFLRLENEAMKCFYTNSAVAPPLVSIDHVIPWSFMYSDDLWNLVVTSKSLNSTMGNQRPEAEDIERLKERNKRLLKQMMRKFPSKKETFDLDQSIRRNFLDEYFFALG